MATWQAGRAARGCVGRLRGGDLLFWERPCSVFFPLVFALCSFFFVLFFRTLPAGAAALRMPRLLRSEPSGALLLHSPYLVLVGAVVFVVFFLLRSLGRGAPARPPAAEANNTIASTS